MSSHCLPAASPFPASASYSTDVPSPLRLCPSVERDVEFYSYRSIWKYKAGCRDALRANGQFCCDLYYEDKRIEMTETRPKGHALTPKSTVKTMRCWDFPGGAVVKNLPANAGDTGLSPGLGRSHMLQSN